MWDTPRPSQERTTLRINTTRVDDWDVLECAEPLLLQRKTPAYDDDVGSLILCLVLLGLSDELVAPV